MIAPRWTIKIIAWGWGDKVRKQQTKKKKNKIKCKETKSNARQDKTRQDNPQNKEKKRIVVVII